MDEGRSLDGKMQSMQERGSESGFLAPMYKLGAATCILIGTGKTDRRVPSNPAKPVNLQVE